MAPMPMDKEEEEEEEEEGKSPNWLNCWLEVELDRLGDDGTRTYVVMQGNLQKRQQTTSTYRAVEPSAFVDADEETRRDSLDVDSSKADCLLLQDSYKRKKRKKIELKKIEQRNADFVFWFKWLDSLRTADENSVCGRVEEVDLLIWLVAHSSFWEWNVDFCWFHSLNATQLRA